MIVSLMGPDQKEPYLWSVRVNHVAMGAMTMGKSLYFVTSMLLCAPLHGLKFVISPLFVSSPCEGQSLSLGLPGALDEN